MRLSGFVVLFILATCSGAGQNLLGYDTNDILKYMQKNHPNLVMESNFRNDHYKYLKFTDGDRESTTVMFFMSDRDRCTSIRAIYDFSLKDEVISNLDRQYTRTGEYQWSDMKRRNSAKIEFSAEEWFITVSIKPEKQN